MRIFAALVLLFAAAVAAAAGADADRTLEQRVKAAYLLRFAEFIAWPEGSFASPDAPIVIGVSGANGIAAELALVATGRAVAGRRIEVRRIGEPGIPPGPLHMIFVGAADQARIAQAVRGAPKHTVIVTDADGALAQGSLINFVIVDGKVRFEVSLEAAERRGIRLSARLLAVAHVVRGTP